MGCRKGCRKGFARVARVSQWSIGGATLKKRLSHARMNATIAGLLRLFTVEIHWLYLLG